MTSRIGVDYRDTLAVFGSKQQVDEELVTIYRKNLSAIGYAANEFRDRHDDSAYYLNSGDQIGEAIGVIPADMADAVKLQAYCAALRWLILTRWCMWILIPLAMSISVGLMARRLKRDTFEPPRPPVYNSAAHILLAVLFVSLLWLVCPVVPITVTAVPLILTLSCVVISAAIANYPEY